MEIALQARGLWVSALAGLGVGLFYDLLRILRRRRGGAVWSAALDLLFWAGVGWTLWAVTLWAGDGKVRAWHAIAIGVGCAVYLMVFSPLLLPAGLAAAEAAARIWRVITLPLALLLAAQKKFCEILKNHFHYWQKWVIIELFFAQRPGKRPSTHAKGAQVHEIQAEQLPVQDRGADPAGFRGHHTANLPAERGDARCGLRPGAAGRSWRHNACAWC